MAAFRTVHIKKETDDLITDCIEIFKLENPSDNRNVSKNFMVHRALYYWKHKGKI